MIFNALKFITLCLLVGLLLLSTGTFAQEKDMSKNEAAQQAQKVVKGRVLKVRQSKSKYKVKVLQKSGRVVTVDVDKKSGKVSSSKKDR